MKRKNRRVCHREHGDRLEGIVVYFVCATHDQLGNRQQAKLTHCTPKLDKPDEFMVLLWKYVKERTVNAEKGEMRPRQEDT